LAVTVIGPETISLPLVVSTPIIETKENWTDEWQIRPDLQFSSASLPSAAHDLAALTFVSRYGRTKEIQESSFSTKEPLSLSGYWVRLKLSGSQGLQETWIGRVYNESRYLFGSSPARSGLQQWVAYGPLRELQRKYISRSYWKKQLSNEKDIGWVPDFNARDKRRLLVGNRTSAKSGGSYLFGGTDKWTRRDMLEYVLVRFADESGSSGPSWTLAGQLDILEDSTDTVAMKDVQTVAEALRRIIPTSLGVDYTIQRTETGFEVFVYALTAEETSFNGATLPKNPDTVRLKRTSDAIDVERSHIVRSNDNKFSKIRILGRRIVVCHTRRFSNDTLAPKWTSAVETEYKDGTGNPADAGSVHDAARRRDKFRPVYQLFGAPNVDWIWPPEIDANGSPTGAVNPNYQMSVRETLRAIPLREGYDYSSDPPADSNPSGHEPDLVPVQVWLYDKTNARYVTAEEAGIGVSVTRFDWGVFLSASPNHKLALNHWSGANDTASDPKYDYEKIVVTMAAECDQRLALEYELADGDGSVLELLDEAAELWYLEADTVVGVDKKGNLEMSGPEGRVLRNDAQRLAGLMAGAIARYAASRARAEIHIRGLLPYGDLVGRILTVIEDAGDIEDIGAPITEVSWSVGKDGSGPRTIIKTGFAL